MLLNMRFVLVIFSFSFVSNLFAQLGSCPSNLMYMHQDNGKIGQLDLTNNNYSLNTISTPAGGSGLAYGDVNGISPSPTFFTVVNGLVYYYNGTTWTNTGHSSGNASAVNITAGGGYLFLLDGIGGRIYRYDGTGNSVQILTVPSNPGPFDLASDIDGNFYFLKTRSAPYELTKYSPTGAILCTWNVTGMNGITSGGGFGFIGDRLYAVVGSSLHTGVFGATTVAFTSATVPGGSNGIVGDLASCPLVTPLTSFVSDTALSCTFSALQITVSPPSILPATYQWTGPSVVGASNTQTITVGQPGLYTVVITPALGCPVTKTINVPGPSMPVVSATMTQQMSCSGSFGAAAASINGGVAPYSYLWSTGATTSTISNLLVGTYTVTVNDAQGCTSSDTVTITGDATTLVAALTTSAIACFGAQTGSIASNVTVGQAPYTYLWSTGANTSSVTGLAAGTYSVTIRDSVGCQVVLTETLGQPDELIASADANPSVICIGDSALIKGVAQGGTLPYTLQWIPGGSVDYQFLASPITTTSYQLNVTDANGCKTTANTQLLVDATPNADFGVNKTVVDIDNPTIEITNLSTDVNTWNFTLDGQSFYNESTIRYEFGDLGVYCIHLEVFTNNGCVDTISKCIEVVPGYSFYIPNSFSPNEDKLNTVFMPVANGVIEYKMEIFNRWGDKIFETVSLNIGWNGMEANSSKLLPQGVYVYKIAVVDRFNREHEYLGNINLLR